MPAKIVDGEGFDCHLCYSSKQQHAVWHQQSKHVCKEPVTAIPDCCLEVLKENFSVRFIVQDVKCKPPQS